MEYTIHILYKCEGYGFRMCLDPHQDTAGRAFAPNCIVDNMNIQDYLQPYYIVAFGQPADRIRRADEEQGLDPPYTRLVVGTNFDIKNAEFRCVVRVSEAEAGEMGVTEIYLPLVHFASDEVPSLNVRERIQRTGKCRVEMETPKTYGLPRGFVPDPDTNDNDNDDDSSEQQRSTTRRRRVLESIQGKLDLLDVEVNVSCGEWRIRGQTFYWSYLRFLSFPFTPTQNRTEGETGEREVTIEVKRRGDAVKMRRGGWVGVKSSDRKQQLVKGRGKEERKGWCERLCECNFGCAVMIDGRGLMVEGFFWW
ncbi:hypothetical protein AN958_01691 [Leucoagaricus sp. SymC.cos]|nr:hypothetical protein AN958_01691 [Leucoagaricus sp. SymC.cos]